MSKRLISYGDHPLNAAGLETSTDSDYTQPGRKIEITELHAGEPQITAIAPQIYELPPLYISLRDVDDYETARRALMAAFYTPDNARALVREDVATGRLEYIMAACRSITPAPNTAGRQFVALLVADRDQHWQSVTETVVNWTVTDTPGTETIAIDVDGDLPVNPTIRITPRTQKGLAVRSRNVKLQWGRPFAHEGYPVSINLMADAMIFDDLVDDETNVAVYVNGREVRRWITDWPTEAAQAWINLDMGPERAVKYAGYDNSPGVPLPGGTEPESIIVNGSLDDWPQQGIATVGSQVIWYGAIDRVRGRLLEIKRGLRGTGQYEVQVNNSIVLEQHHIELVYGRGVTAATAFPDDVWPNGDMLDYDDRKPMLNLAESSNSVWAWDQFGHDRDPDNRLNQLPRPARWRTLPSLHHEYSTGPEDDPDANPYTEMHISLDTDRRRPPTGGWSVTIPHDIIQIAEYDAYGYIRYNRTDLPDAGTSRLWDAALSARTQERTYPIVEFPVPSELAGPIAQQAWEQDYSIDQNIDLVAIGRRVPAGAKLRLTLGGSGVLDLRLRRLAIWLAGAGISQGDEQTPYIIDSLLEANDQGLTISLNTQVDKTLEINAAAGTVKEAGDDVNLYHAVTRDAPRRHLLQLTPGNNTLTYTEVGNLETDIQITYREKWF